MDEGIGVEHLHCAGIGQRLFQAPPGRFTEFQRQDGPDAFAASQKAVAHGVQQGFLGDVLGKVCCQIDLYQTLTAL